MPLSGVRISWLMLARNSDLARLASRARRWARSSCMFCTSTVSMDSSSSAVAWATWRCISSRASWSRPARALMRSSSGGSSGGSAARGAWGSPRCSRARAASASSRGRCRRRQVAVVVAPSSRAASTSSTPATPTWR